MFYKCIISTYCITTEYTCLENYRKCGDGRQCVRVIDFCDGHHQCNDRSDESNCEGKNMVHTYYMHIVLVQLFVSCTCSVLNRITTRRMALSSDAVCRTDET